MANKGEKSETYVILKLAGEGILVEGDENLNPVPENVYRLLKIILNRNLSAETFFLNLENDNTVSVSTSRIAEISRAPRKDFLTAAKHVLNEIKNSSNGEKPNTGTSFLNKLGVSFTKSSSGQKNDLQVVVIDRGTQKPIEFGFSIKSNLGADPTLVNASKATRLRYRLSESLPQDVIETFNTLRKNNKTDWDGKFRILSEYRIELDFVGCTESIYEENLSLVDTQFPRVLAQMVLNYYKNRRLKKFTSAVEQLAADNPISLSVSNKNLIYETLVKRFLHQHVLGMNAKTSWDGNYSVTGGCIVVKSDGNLVCFYTYNFNKLDDFLFRSAAFDTPSAKKHEFGTIERVGNDLFLNLNFQVRDTLTE